MYHEVCRLIINIFLDFQLVYLTSNSTINRRLSAAPTINLSFFFIYWPICIFCSAKDESNWPMWPEIKSRFFITSPNMIRQKYEESNVLIGQKAGYPSIVQEQLVISPKEIQLYQLA